MRRREFVAGVAATVLPLAARAQRVELTRRVDMLIAEAIEDDP
jgi:hypothetical protein